MALSVDQKLLLDRRICFLEGKVLGYFFFFSISFVENAFLFPTWLCSEVTTGIYKESHMKFPQEAVVGEMNKSQLRDVPYVLSIVTNVF